MADGTSEQHPSELALEKYLLREHDDRRQDQIREHVSVCARCRTRLEVKAAEATRFKDSATAARARDAFRAADLSWRRRMKLLALVPAIFLAALAMPSIIASLKPQPAPAADAPDASTAVTVAPRRHVQVAGDGLELEDGKLYVVAGGERGPLVLEHTSLEGEVTPAGALLTLTQSFSNPFRGVSDGVWLMPVPHGTALEALEVKTGKRVLRVEGMRADAARNLGAGPAKGSRRDWVREEEGDLVVQPIPQLEPNANVTVTAKLLVPVLFEDGRFALEFPLTSSARGLSTESGRLDLKLHVSAGTAPLGSVEAGPFELERGGDSDATVRSSPGGALPDRLRLTFSVQGTSSLLVSTSGAEPSFAFVVLPDAALPPVPQHLSFVLDLQENGAPADLVEPLLRRLIPLATTFDITRLTDFAPAFQSSSAVFPPRAKSEVDAFEAALRPAHATEEGRAHAPGLLAALGKRDGARTVVLISDAPSVPRELLALRREPDAPPLFTVALRGPADATRLQALAALRGGAFEAIRGAEQFAAGADAVARALGDPALTSIDSSWNGLPVSDVAALTPLRVGHRSRLVVAGHFAHPSEGELLLHALSAAGPTDLRIPVKFPATGTSNVAAALSDRSRLPALFTGTEPQHQEQLIALAMKHLAQTPVTARVVRDEPSGASWTLDELPPAAEAKEETRRRLAIAEAPPYETEARKTFSALVQDREPRFLACYDDELRRDSRFEAHLTAELEFDRDGRLMRARVQSEGGGAEALITCVQQVLDGLRVPPTLLPARMVGVALHFTPAVQH